MKQYFQNTGHFRAKQYLGDDPALSRSACGTSFPTSWALLWSDEFDDVPDNTKCYNSDDHLQCVYKSYWTYRTCVDAPTSWTAASRADWTAAQHAAFDGLVNLNKCVWHVHDGFNSWESAEKKSRFSKENVSVQNGVLTLKTTANIHPTPYDCGLDYNNGQFDTTSTDCPYSNSMLWSHSLLPWTAGHSWNDPDPEKRYTGMMVGPGPSRIEFRARIDMMGHGAWPGLWFFVDQKYDSSQGNGELDALEFLADLQGRPDQVSNNNATYGMAWQTAHNWSDPSETASPISDGVGIPITIGEWHTYAVEFDDGEIRFFVDECLRNRLTDGQLVQLADGTFHTFHVPKNQTYHIFMNAWSSSASWLPAWYQAYSGDPLSPVRGDFVPTRITVDYVRVYEVP